MTQEEIIAKAYQAYPDIRLTPLSDDENLERREGYIRALTELNIDAIRGEAMHKVVDAYEALPSIEGWIARDKDESLHLFSPEKPKRLYRSYWMNTHLDLCELSKNMFPSLEWKDNPIQVKLLIKKVL